jgi:hypothetical protein
VLPEKLDRLLDAVGDGVLEPRRLHASRTSSGTRLRRAVASRRSGSPIPSGDHTGARPAPGATGTQTAAPFEARAVSTWQFSHFALRSTEPATADVASCEWAGPARESLQSGRSALQTSSHPVRCRQLPSLDPVNDRPQQHGCRTDLGLRHRRSVHNRPARHGRGGSPSARPLPPKEAEAPLSATGARWLRVAGDAPLSGPRRHPSGHRLRRRAGRIPPRPFWSAAGDRSRA